MQKNITKPTASNIASDRAEANSGSKQPGEHEGRHRGANAHCRSSENIMNALLHG